MGKYFVNCQHQYYSGNYLVEIAYPDQDSIGSDMLATNYADEGEYSDPREALEAAIKVRDALQVDYPKEKIGIAFGRFDMVEGEAQDLEELRAEIEKHYESLPKCDRCGKLRNEDETYTIYSDPSFGKFCSEYCAEEAYIGDEKEYDEEE